MKQKTVQVSSKTEEKWKKEWKIGELREQMKLRKCHQKYLRKKEEIRKSRDLSGYNIWSAFVLQLSYLSFLTSVFNVSFSLWPLSLIQCGVRSRSHPQFRPWFWLMIFFCLYFLEFMFFFCHKLYFHCSCFSFCALYLYYFPIKNYSDLERFQLLLHSFNESVEFVVEVGGHGINYLDLSISLMHDDLEKNKVLMRSQYYLFIVFALFLFLSLIHISEPTRPY